MLNYNTEKRGAVTSRVHNNDYSVKSMSSTISFGKSLQNKYFPTATKKVQKFAVSQAKKAMKNDTVKNEMKK